MRAWFLKGLGFGLTSGIITTLGLIVGLYASSKSFMVVIGGIFVIAISDAFSDAFGIHISEESNKSVSEKHIWGATYSTFLFKFLFAMIFVPAFFVFSLFNAVVFSVLLGIFLICGFSFYVARVRGTSSVKAIVEHFLIAVVVVVVSYFVGDFVGRVFG